MLGIIHLVGAQKFSEKRYFGSITTHTYHTENLPFLTRWYAHVRLRIKEYEIFQKIWCKN